MQNKTKISFSRTEKILLALMAALNFCHIVDFMILMPLGAQLMRLFDITPKQFGFLVSAYTFSAAISSLLGVLFLDRFDRKNALLFLGAGFALGTLFCGFAPTYLSLLVGRCLAGFFGGMLGSCVLSIVSDAISFERRGTAMGVVMGSFSVASVFGVPFSLYLAQTFGWHFPFVFLAGLSVVILFVIFMIMQPMRDHIHRKKGQTEAWWKPFQRALQSRVQLLSLLFLFFLVMGQFTVIPFVSPGLVANAGMLESQLPLVYIFGGIASFFASPTVGRLSDLYGKEKLFMISALFSLIPIVWITHLQTTPLALILIAVVLFFVSMSGRMVPAMTLISESTEPEHRGSFMSLISSVQQLSAAIASIVGSFIVVKTESGRLIHYEIVGWVAVVASCSAIFVLSFLSSEKAKNKSLQSKSKAS